MPVLAVDIGGTKSLAALAEGPTLIETLTLPTDQKGTPEVWLENLRAAVGGWQGRYDGAAFAVTGLVSGGYWSALNTATLNITERFPLETRARALFGHAPTLANDAQAAAYGEFAFGAGQGEDMVFLTVSTGVGGGIVSNGRLVTGASGLAGHYGQTRGPRGQRFEDKVSGRAIERHARALGQTMSVPEIFDAAANGTCWADDIIETSARGVAALCANIQLTIDPARIVIGGGVGLATGYIDRISNHLEHLQHDLRPALSPAALGANAGVLGIAALHQKQDR